MIDRIDHRHAYSSHRRRDVPPGQFITAMGGGTSRMWAELRMPTLAEMRTIRPVMTVIDGEVVHDNGALGQHHGR